MPTRRRSGRLGRAVVVLLACVAVAVGVLVLVHRGVGPLPNPEGCQARVGGVVVDLSTEQAENATTIVAVAVRRNLPARAASIALATAYQESKLQNLDHGDRDSLGLFQQRPSQGWGTAKQIRDPIHAVNAFYDALEKVHGYQTMKVTEAAQAVQRSAFPSPTPTTRPTAAPSRRAHRLQPGPVQLRRGDRTAAPPRRRRAATGSPRAPRVKADLTKAFGSLPLGGFAPGGVSTGHMKGSAHYDGRAVDVFVRPISAAHKRTGWAIASYLVAHAVAVRDRPCHLRQADLDGGQHARSRAGAAMTPAADRATGPCSSTATTCTSTSLAGT